MMGKIWQKFAAHKEKMCKYIYIRYNMIILGKKGLCQGELLEKELPEKKLLETQKLQDSRLP